MKMNRKKKAQTLCIILIISFITNAFSSIDTSAADYYVDISSLEDFLNIPNVLQANQEKHVIVNYPLSKANGLPASQTS